MRNPSVIISMVSLRNGFIGSMALFTHKHASPCPRYMHQLKRASSSSPCSKAYGFAPRVHCSDNTAFHQLLIVGVQLYAVLTQLMTMDHSYHTLQNAHPKQEKNLFLQRVPRVPIQTGVTERTVASTFFTALPFGSQSNMEATFFGSLRLIFMRGEKNDCSGVATDNYFTLVGYDEGDEDDAGERRE